MAKRRSHLYSISLYDAPIGKFFLGFKNKTLCFSSFTSPKRFEDWAKKQRVELQYLPIEKQYSEALDCYFYKKQPIPAFPLLFLSGTLFEQQVWKSLMSIRHGEVKTYAWIAETIGKPKAFRAVGQANGKNWIPLFVPCHRVVYADQRLGGYSEGVWIKKALLEMESF